jgi:hypothetical protein
MNLGQQPVWGHRHQGDLLGSGFFVRVKEPGKSEQRVTRSVKKVRAFLAFN